MPVAPHTVSSAWLERRVLRLDLARLSRANDRMRTRFPSATLAELAERIAWGAAIAGAAVSATCGMPGGALALPCMVAEQAALRRIEVRIAARLALLRDPRFFDGAADPLDRLLVLLGGGPGGRPARVLLRRALDKVASAVLGKMRARALRGMRRRVPFTARVLGSRAFRLAPVLDGIASALRTGVEVHRRAVGIDRLLAGRAPAGADVRDGCPTMAHAAQASGRGRVREIFVQAAAAAFRAHDAIAAAAAWRCAAITEFVEEARARARAPRPQRERGALYLGAGAASCPSTVRASSNCSGER